MIIESPDAMREAGRDFALRLRSGDIVALHGGLGAGKTLFCKGVLEGFGFRGDVPSPTFTIVHHYDPPDVALAIIHADLYRLNNPQEVEELGLFDDVGDSPIRLVEWAEHSGGAFENVRFRVCINRLDESRRELMIEESETAA
jgi:tRNA threonylcarbamoyladenosine biosynthesis protein TsaE